MHPTSQVADRQPAPPTLLVRSSDQVRLALNICPSAQSLWALSPDLGATLLIAIPCKLWSCPLCARLKIAALSAKTRDAAPNRLLTLTVDPNLYDSPRAAFDATRSQVPELIRLLRKRYGDVEYLRVTELTKRGYPHYHLLVRSPYLPHPVVKKEWHRLTGAIVVDLRQVQRSWSAYKYLVKYLSKLHKIEWTERHVSYSKHFFPAPPQPFTASYSLIEKKLLHSHPATYLAEYYQDQTVTILSRHVYNLS